MFKPDIFRLLKMSFLDVVVVILGYWHSFRLVFESVQNMLYNI